MCLLEPPVVVPAKAGTQGSEDGTVALGPACSGATIELSGSHLTCHGKAAAGAAHSPAGDDTGKHAGIATGANDHNPAGAELVDRFAGEGGGSTLADVFGIGDEVRDRDFAEPVELLIEPRLRPAGILEGAVMLGADHQQRVARRRVFYIAQRSQRPGKAARQALGVARLLIDDTLQPVASEHRHRRLAGL